MLHNLKSWLGVLLCVFGQHKWWWSHDTRDGLEVFECAHCSAYMTVDRSYNQEV